MKCEKSINERFFKHKQSLCCKYCACGPKFAGHWKGMVIIMKQQMIRKSMCFVLIIAILIFGMCFDIIHTDSLNLINNSHQSTNICSSEHIMFSNIFCLYEDNLGQSSELVSAIRQSVRRNITRIGRNADINLLYVGNLSQYFQISVSHTICGVTPVIFNNLIISNYIHEKDGKKA